MKKLVLRNPESLTHRYNLCVLLHNSAQQILEQKERKKEQTEKSIEFLKKIQPFYDYLFKNHYARKSRDELEKCDDARRKSKRFMDKIREASENKLNYIQSHQDRFDSFLREDEEVMKRKLQGVEEKKRKIQEMKERELMEKAEKERREEAKRIEYERLAYDQMLNAEKIAEDLRRKHENEKPKAPKKPALTKRKSKKPKDDEESIGGEDREIEDQKMDNEVEHFLEQDEEEDQVFYCFYKILGFYKIWMKFFCFCMTKFGLIYFHFLQKGFRWTGRRRG